MRTSSRRGSKRSRTASVLRDEEESLALLKRTGTPIFSPTPAASETEPDREPQIPNTKLAQDDKTPQPEPKPSETEIKEEEEPSSIPEVVVEPADVLPPTTKQPNGSEPGSTEDDGDSKSSPLTETSLISDQMASVAVFPPSTDITQKGVRTMEDLEMGNTESDRPSPDRSSAPPSLSQPYMNGQSPESSSLSELDSDDSEAETERLNISPQKPPIGTGSNLASYSTPKKSIGESTLTSPSRSPSPLTTSPKSPDREMTLGAIEQLTPEGSVIGSTASSPGRKRKRGESEGLEDEEKEEEDDEETKMEMEISDLEEPPKKKNGVDDSKSHTSDEEEEDEEEEEEDEDEDQDGELEKKPKISSPNGHADEVEDDSADDEDDESPKPAQRSPERNKPKPGSAKASPTKPTSIKVTDTDADEDLDEERDTDAAESNQQGKDDEEADETSKTKRAAADELANIEILFAQLRDKIVEERVAEIDKEIAMVQDGTHPELLLMSKAIEQHKQEKVDKANTLRGFQLETAEVERVANRAAIWSQYGQEIRELREEKFSEANKLWWSIHRERRAADTSVSDYVYKIPKSFNTQINHRSRYNAEVSLLSGIAKNVGFPAAPEIMGATADETRADMEAMGLAPPPLPISVLPPSSHPFPISTPSQAGPSRLPQMSTFGRTTGNSPRPSKASIQAPPAPNNTFQLNPSSYTSNPEIRRPRTPPSPVQMNPVHQAQKIHKTSSPRPTKTTKGKAAKAQNQAHDGAAEPPSKRVPIKLENSPTISSLTFAPSSRDFVTQQTIDRRMQQVGGGTGFRPFGK